MCNNRRPGRSRTRRGHLPHAEDGGRGGTDGRRGHGAMARTPRYQQVMPGTCCHHQRDTCIASSQNGLRLQRARRPRTNAVPEGWRATQREERKPAGRRGNAQDFTTAQGEWAAQREPVVAHRRLEHALVQPGDAAGHGAGGHSTFSWTQHHHFRHVWVAAGWPAAPARNLRPAIRHGLGEPRPPAPTTSARTRDRPNFTGSDRETTNTSRRAPASASGKGRTPTVPR